jgi:trehalose-6-phosphate synthase
LPVVLRIVAASLLGLLLLLLAVLAFAPGLTEQWSRRDAEERSRLVFEAVRGRVVESLSQNAPARLTEIFGQVSADEEVLGIAYCSEAGQVLASSRRVPPDFNCAAASRSAQPSFTVLSGIGRQILIGSFPLPVGADRGHLAVLNDLNIVARRGAETRAALFLALAMVALGAVVIAALVGLVMLRRWLAFVRQAIEDARAGRPTGPETDPLPLGLGEDVRAALRELDASRRAIDVAHVEWSPETLRAALGQELAGTEVIVVSNREPYIHNRTEEGISLQIPASGLVAALEPVMRACGGTWIAHGSGSADRETVDADDRVAVPPRNPAYALRRLWLSEEEQEGYYYGFANEGLWPLCHIAFVRPIFRESDWRMYRAVNEKFADAVAAEATRPDPIVLIQDYHFGLLPRMVRDRLPEATIITFWHIPWPNAETFGICPYKQEIVDGLLGSSILGFHTQFHCNNFLETVDRFVESRIDRERDSISYGGGETLVRPYPISIDWPPAALEGQRPVPEARTAVRERLHLPPDIRLGVGIERFDYTKGILDRMRAVDAFLTERPEWRSKLASYRTLQEEAVTVAAEINERHRVDGVEPIVLAARHHEPDEVFELFRAADLCIVSSLHDGMNLVAKEFVAARDDERGVLVLSAFAGASRELNEALIVNPYDNHAMGEAIHRALTMPEYEQEARMRLMREQVRARNVYRWAGQMLIDAARLRNRARLRRMVDRSETRRRPAHA